MINLDCAMNDKSLTTREKHIKPRLRYDSLGISGTQLSGGIITGVEKNPNLFGESWIDEAESMLMTDATVRKSWIMVKQTLLSATWKWETANEDDEECNKLADYANECFGFDGYSGMMNRSFHSMLEYLVEAFPIGYRYAEEIYYVAPGKDGRVKVWLDEYADREPSAHMKWLSRNGQDLDGVLQKVVGIHKTPRPIPANKLLLINVGQTGSNWAGVGMLRPAHWYFRTKQRVSNLLVVAAERWSVPTPKIVIDRSVANEQGYTDTDIDSMIDSAEGQAEAFMSAENQYLVEGQAVKFDVYAPAPSFQQGPLQILERCNAEIMSAFLTEFSILGQTSTGSRSVGEIHNSTFRRACITLLNRISDQIGGVDRAGGGTIGRLIRWNFGNVSQSKLPKLRHYGLDTDELADSLQMLPSLVTAGLLTPDDTLEHAIRDRLGATQLSEDSKRSPEDRKLPLSPVGGAMQLAEQILRKKNGKKN